MISNLRDRTIVDPYREILAHLVYLYGEGDGKAVFDALRSLMEKYTPVLRSNHPAERGDLRLTERDAILITYGDQVTEPGVAPLRTLGEFCVQYLSGLIDWMHILPFFPYSSDDGFSVIDYRQVNAALGSWEDIARLRKRFHLMFDLVLNHVSAQSAWFQGFLQGDPKYEHYFIVVEGDVDLSQVVRPRALPLLTAFMTPGGEKRVWTTFSADQVDLNYHNPEVLLEIIDILLFYVSQGAELIRLDAIAYLWKEIGTPCIHLPQTHRIVQLLRLILDILAPHVLLITETNVPHAENLSYFGDGTNEAQLVYNFALPPLVLHALLRGDGRILSRWAAGLKLPSRRVGFLNFLASHDGIGLNPARGILAEDEIRFLVEHTLANGGLVSYKHNPDGSQSPYELNINYFDALARPDRAETTDEQIERFMAAQAIMLSLAGVPGIYFHSLFGSRGWPEGVRLTGQKRSINRQKLERAALEREIHNTETLRHRVYQKYAQLLKARSNAPAFHPLSEQQVIDCGRAIFALLRYISGREQVVLCLHNLSDRSQKAEIPLGRAASVLPEGGIFVDLLSGRQFGINKNEPTITLAPYQVLWLAHERDP